MGKNNNKSRGKLFAAVILMILAIAIIIVTIRFVRHRIAYAVIDAVFVRTDTLTAVGFNRVNGRVTTITKKNGDQVNKCFMRFSLFIAADDRITCNAGHGGSIYHGQCTNHSFFPLSS